MQPEARKIQRRMSAKTRHFDASLGTENGRGGCPARPIDV
jgi:hypothetical protein